MPVGAGERRPMSGRRRVTPARRAANRLANRRHGLHSQFAFGHAGEAVLQPEQRSRLAELRADLATPEGVRLALVERAARLVLVAEWGEAWLRQKAEQDGPVAAFTAPMLGRFFTAAAEARRALVEVAKLYAGGGEDGITAARVLESLKDGD